MVQSMQVRIDCILLPSARRLARPGFPKYPAKPVRNIFPLRRQITTYAHLVYPMNSRTMRLAIAVTASA